MSVGERYGGSPPRIRVRMRLSRGKASGDDDQRLLGLDEGVRPVALVAHDQVDVRRVAAGRGVGVHVDAPPLQPTRSRMARVWSARYLSLSKPRRDTLSRRPVMFVMGPES